MFLAPLEGLRGIAAVGVVLYHSWYHWHINGIGLVRNGKLYVDLFFVISGFVISHIYASRLRDTRDLAQFAALRTARLYPLHLFTLLLLVCYTLVSAWLQADWHLRFSSMHTELLGHNTGRHFLENLFLLQALLAPNFPSFNSPSWSISTEFFTYFIFAITVLLVGRYRKQLPWVFAFLALTSLGYLFQDGSLTHHTRLLRCIGGFFTGTLVYVAWSRLQAGMRHWLDKGWRAHIVEMAALVLATAVLCDSDEGRRQFLVLLCFALVVFLLADGRGLVTQFLKHRHIQYLGKWSYSIYMVHFTVILVFSDLAQLWWQRGPAEFMRWDAWQTSLLTLSLVAVVLAVASQTYRFVEDPPRRWAKHWVSKRFGGRAAKVPDAQIGAP